jgi:hypothetical protein
VTVSIEGRATWYAYHPGQAAAGWALRRAIGPGWRGTLVRVCAGRCVVVLLTDFMASADHRKVIDLDVRDFAALAPTSRGVIAAEVGW